MDQRDLIRVDRRKSQICIRDSIDVGNKRTGTTINGATEGESRISEGSGFGREGRVVGSPRGRRLVEPP